MIQTAPAVGMRSGAAQARCGPAQNFRQARAARVIRTESLYMSRTAHALDGITPLILLISQPDYGLDYLAPSSPSLQLLGSGGGGGGGGVGTGGDDGGGSDGDGDATAATARLG